LLETGLIPKRSPRSVTRTERGWLSRKVLFEVLMRGNGLVFGLLFAAAGCSAATDTVGSISHQVEVVATVTRRSANGDSVTIQIRNTGTQAAFVSRCGAGPLLLMQQFVNGEWIGGVQNFACPVPAAPGPIRLEAGESISQTRVFDIAGRYRFRTPVGSSEDLSDATQAVSNPFDVP
jgi:hypothetical protein